MKKLLIPIIFATLLIIQPVFAQTPELTDPVENTDGILPDSPLYFFDTLFDNVFLGLQTNDVERAKIAIKIASERLAEVKIMITERKLDQAEKAQVEHDKVLNEAENSVKKIKDTDLEREARDKVRINTDLDNHKKKIQRVNDDLEIFIKVKGNITTEQIERIRLVLENVDQKTDSVKISIDNSKENTKMRVKMQTNENEARTLITRIETDERIRTPEVKVDVDRDTNTSKVEAEIDGRMQRFDLQSTDPETIIKLITGRIAITDAELRKVIEFDSEERKSTLGSIRELQLLGRK
jgi:hypothetical protein